MLGQRDLSRAVSQCSATTVLVLALVGLYGFLANFRPHTIEKTSLLNHNSFVSIYPSGRKLLQFNISVHTHQEVNLSSPREGNSNAREKDCAEVHHLEKPAERCQFVKSTDSCVTNDGFIQYFKIPYCSFPHAVPLAVALLVLWLVFLFITLGLTADDYFCPSLAVISKTLHLSQNVAGVTFLAYGNGAPDIFSALAALSHSKNQNGVQLGIQALFGAGMFVTTVVVGVMSFLATVTVASRPFTRDVLFYLGAVSWVFLTLHKENITIGESIGFIAFYVVYILVVIGGHFIYQRWKRKLRARDRLSESRQAERRKLISAVRGSKESIPSLPIDTESCDVTDDRLSTDEPLTLSDALYGAENTFFAPAVHNIPNLIGSHYNSSTSGERLPLLGRQHEVSACNKFLRVLIPFDREEWNQSNWFWKWFLICKIPSLLFLNLTIPVVDYDKENHNWNKWLTVLHCFTMPVFCAFATRRGNILIGGRFPVFALALCVGVIFALIVAMVTSSDRQPRAHFLFAYLAFVVSVIWIYTTATEIVNLLQTFGIVFGLSDAILGLTLLAWGNSIGDLVSNSAMARQGFSPMAVSACFGGPLLNMLLGIGISCTILTVSRDRPIPLLHQYHQYLISAAFLAASLCSSAIIIPLLGFKVPRVYGVYLILLYISYLTTSIVAEIEHI